MEDSSKFLKQKIIVNFVPIAGAERLARPRLEFYGELTVRHVAVKLRGMLSAENDEPLHIFLAQGFAPSPDNTLIDLFSAYATDGRAGTGQELVLKYSHQVVHG